MINIRRIKSQGTEHASARSALLAENLTIIISMQGLKIYIILLLSVIHALVSGQVKIRLFANQSPESAVFTVINGNYICKFYHGGNFILAKR